MTAHIKQPNTGEVLRYLGYRGQEMSSQLAAQIEACGREVAGAAKFAVIYKHLPIEEISAEKACAGDAAQPADDPGARLSEIFLPGKDIAAHLKGCGDAILMAATLGADVERLLLKNEVSDMSRALIMDACATQLIEEYLDAFENELRESMAGESLYLTGRFSPGYGDLPIEIQGEIAAVLDTHRKIGLTVSKTHLLIPRKSVTAVLGISQKPVRLSARGCDLCSKKADCSFRKEKRKCNE